MVEARPSSVYFQTHGEGIYLSIVFSLFTVTIKNRLYIKFFVILGLIYVINPLSIRVYHNIANTIHIIHNIYYLGSFTSYDKEFKSCDLQ